MSELGPLLVARLTRLREGRWVAGVCNGLAAALGVQVDALRAVVLLLAIAFVMRWSVGLSLLALAIITAMYVGACLLHGPFGSADRGVFVNVVHVEQSRTVTIARRREPARCVHHALSHSHVRNGDSAELAASSSVHSDRSEAKPDAVSITVIVTTSSTRDGPPALPRNQCGGM